MSAGGEDDFGAVDPTPRAPYKPSQRRHQSDDEGDAVNRHDWYCLPAPEPVPQPQIDLSIHPSGLQPVLQNVVSTFSMGCCVNLKEIVQKARNAEYNPRRFSAVILRLREPKTTALIFSSGKGVCTGAKDETESKLAARKFARMVQKFGYEATFKNFRIQNLVASVDVGFTIFLEQMKAAERHFNIYYEPEIFPGMLLKVLRPKVTVLIFVSGKVVITGAKVKDSTRTKSKLLQSCIVGN